MSLFSDHKERSTGGVIVDIGSGSVGVAIVQTSPTSEPAKILWSHREYALKKSQSGTAVLMREVHTALINALLELGSNGLRDARYIESGVQLSLIQVTLCAPWAHTATKTIHCKKDEPFTVSNAFLRELVHASIKETQIHTDKLTELGFETISETIAEILLNEYVVLKPIDAVASAVTLSVMTSAVQKKMLETITESCEKILSDTPVEFHSFMSVLHKTLQHLKPNTTEIGIIDVTDEATEIGFVRDDVLRSATHRPTGLRTLAFALSRALEITDEESYSLLKRTNEEIIGSYKEKEVNIILDLFSQYETELGLLFNETNDDLFIPHSIFLHTDTDTERFFVERITNTVAKLSANKRMIHLVNEQLLEGIQTRDSALAVCSYYFKENHSFAHIHHLH